MALSVDPQTFVITVPKADLTLIQSVPTEIRELNLNSFRLELKEWEAEGDNANPGITFLKTHTHNTEVSLGGLTYARVVEILAPYTITFEDGQYAVNLVGANSNVGDRVNVNQVSVRSQNSAGLITSTEIQYGVYGGGVTVDVINGKNSSLYPTGTPFDPTNSVENAVVIKAAQKLSAKIFVVGDLTLNNASLNLQHYIFIGENQTTSTITIDTLADVVGCEFEQATVTGVLDGGSKIINCIIKDLNYVNGIVESCIIDPGTITLGGSVGSVAHFIGCVSGVPGTSTPIIDCGGSGVALDIRHYAGGIKLQNKTGLEAVSVDLDSGQCILSSTVTGGTIVCRGVGKLIDEAGDPIPTGTWNGVTIVNETVNPDHIADHVWDEIAEDHETEDTTGDRLRRILYGSR